MPRAFLVNQQKKPRTLGGLSPVALPSNKLDIGDRTDDMEDMENKLYDDVTFCEGMII